MQPKTKATINLEYDSQARILKMAKILGVAELWELSILLRLKKQKKPTATWLRSGINYRYGNSYPARTLRSHIEKVIFSNDGQTLISSSWDRIIRLWQLATGKQIASSQLHSDKINDLALTSNNRTLVSGSADRTIRLWRCYLGNKSK